jgi:hypothetical protein
MEPAIALVVVFHFRMWLAALDDFRNRDFRPWLAHQ